MSISLGLVGLGSFGSEFADLFYSHPLVSRVALCDREPERMEKFATKPSWNAKFNPKDTYTSLDDICRTDLDALVIITQPWLHAPQCIQAMEAGKHVYSAVPVINVPDGDETLDWCDKLVAAHRQTGMHYMLGETTYYRPEAMFCRRKAREGAFGQFVYSEGEYFHDVDEPGCSLRVVYHNRMQGKAGQEALAIKESYRQRGIKSGPMHYPTHSVSGPMCVMNAHAVKVSCFGTPNTTDPFFADYAFSNETALFHLSNGATMRICEHREIGIPGRETFRIYGTKASFEDGNFLDKHKPTPHTVEQMRDPLPTDVASAFAAAYPGKDFYGGHGGSHAYLVHEFVTAIAHNRTPAINVYEAVRYMAAGVIAHKSALKDGELLTIPDWGNAPLRS